MFVVQRFQPLLGCCLCSPDTTQHHLDQFVASAHACLAQQSKHQRMTLARLRDVEKVVHLHGGGFGGELAELGMGDAFQEWVRIERTVQPVEPIDPQLDCLWCCRAGRLLLSAHEN